MPGMNHCHLLIKRFSQRRAHHSSRVQLCADFPAKVTSPANLKNVDDLHCFWLIRVEAQSAFYKVRCGHWSNNLKFLSFPKLCYLSSQPFFHTTNYAETWRDGSFLKCAL